MAGRTDVDVATNIMNGTYAWKSRHRICKASVSVHFFSPVVCTGRKHECCWLIVGMFFKDFFWYQRKKTAKQKIYNFQSIMNE